ncbi:heterogeneous nuclear ribonucleoprotein F-like [Hydra vulgaris]|uniref:Heterogeneous nuclear ribonucleoprotein F-like n=1 Tax=Hydra vulgaris TaxID=6087 RepID=A0ABM4BX69_HYDVU
MSKESYVIKARGLPWSATAAEVIEFFSDVNTLNGEASVHFTNTKEGRPSGECFVEVCSREDVERALAHDQDHMGKRYIEVKEAKQSEMEWVVNRMDNSRSEAIVRLRGLPFDCTKHDIAEFFSGLDISPYGITITMNQDGRASGDAYVEFVTQQDAENALLKHKEKIGHRYIEIFQSSKDDIKYVVGTRSDDHRPSLMSIRPGPYDRPQNFNGPRRGRGGVQLGPSGFNTAPSYSGDFGRNRSMNRGGRSGGMGMSKTPTVQSSKTGHSVHMRGLPFEASVSDIVTFFSPLNPVDVRLMFEPNGRPKGECDVDFATHSDAESAMLKDKQNMGHRYIELFLKSSPNASGWRSESVHPRNIPSGPMLNPRRGNMGCDVDAGGYDNGDSYGTGGGGYGGGYGNSGPRYGNSYNNGPSGYNSRDVSYPMQNHNIEDNFYGN